LYQEGWPGLFKGETVRALSAIGLVLLLAMPSWGELSQRDLEQIGKLIDRKFEPLKEDIAELKVAVARLEGRVDGLEKTVDAFRKEMDARIGELNAKMVSKQWFLTMWVTITLMILAVSYLYGRSDREEIECGLREKPELEDAYRAIGVL